MAHNISLLVPFKALSDTFLNMDQHFVFISFSSALDAVDYAFLLNNGYHHAHYGSILILWTIAVSPWNRASVT